MDFEKVNGKKDVIGYIKDIKDRFEAIHNQPEISYQHEQMRLNGFLIFDSLIEDCQRGMCPDLIGTTKGRMEYEALVKFLTDISIDGYIEEKAYYYAEAGIGSDDKNRYYMANERILRVLNCNMIPTVNCVLLDYDSNSINSHYKENARRRKAYWMYLQYAPYNNPYTDYCGASRFIEEIHETSGKKRCNDDDLSKVMNLVLDYSHIANALDLYRVCLTRKKTCSRRLD